MGQLLHGRARTTVATRKEIQQTQLSIQKIARKYSINPKTAAKWKKRSYTHDAPMGPKKPRSTSLSQEQEASVVAFRKHTLLPLDDCLYALKEAIPNLTRSSLHRCLKRHGINRLPQYNKTQKSPKKKFKKYPIGYFHVDITTVRTEQGTLYLFVAIDRTSKYVYVELHARMTALIASDFLFHLLVAVPYKVHTILTDNGIQFTYRATDKAIKLHPFKRVCIDHGIDHRLTKIAHPWTNGQVERMNGLLKTATVKSYHYTSHDQLKGHLYSFVLAYNQAKRLKALKGLTPYEYIMEIWKKEPHRFNVNPKHFNVELNI